MLRTQDVLGTWTLASFEINYHDGTRDTPYGPNPYGFAQFAPDGLMLIHLSNAERPSQPVPGAARVLPSFISYAARYRLDGDKAIFDVIVSPVTHIPAGARLTRLVSIDDGRLALTVPDALASKPGSARLVWDRTPAAGGAGSE
jgi:hypothetical protein